MRIWNNKYHKTVSSCLIYTAFSGAPYSGWTLLVEPPGLTGVAHKDIRLGAMIVSFSGEGVFGDSIAGNSNSELLVFRSEGGLKTNAGASPVSKLSALGGIVKLPAPRSWIRFRTNARTCARSFCHWPIPSTPPLMWRIHRAYCEKVTLKCVSKRCSKNDASYVQKLLCSQICWTKVI